MTIGDFKTRLRAKFQRRHSHASSVGSANNDEEKNPSREGEEDKNQQSITRTLRERASFRLHRTSIYGGSTNGSSRNGTGTGSGNRNSMVESRNQSPKETSRFEEVIQVEVHDNDNIGIEAGGGDGGERGRGGGGGGGGGREGHQQGDGIGAELRLNFRNSMSSDLQQQLHQHSQTTSPSTPNFKQQSFANSKLIIEEENNKHDSFSTSTDFPTPNTDIPRVLEEDEEEEAEAKDEIQDEPHPEPTDVKFGNSIPQSPISSNNTTHQPTPRKPELSRRQSLLPHQQTKLIKTLLEAELPAQPQVNSIPTGGILGADYFSNHGALTISAAMVTRKIWVKRPGASATLVTIHEDDLVDDVRDMILKKYANSLGRSFDAPDVTLRIIPREQQRQERILGPEEPMSRTLDAYFPGGQTVDEALVIDVPVRRTPKPSPRPNGHPVYYEEGRPTEAGSDYFPPMPLPVPSPGLSHSVPVPNGNQNTAPLIAHAMSVLTTGHVPALPSPSAQRRHHSSRPRIGRTHTSSPTVISGHSQPPVTNNGTQFQRGPRSRTHSSASEKSAIPPPPPLPTPPAPNQELAPQRVATPPPRVSSPRPQKRTRKKAGVDHPSLPAGMLNGAVPPINVLIVEDNIINLKLLEAFMKRLKVRWQTAMNGREAVNKWRGGGFHLVLMDIQLPIMSGLEATKEIRRLERLNSIGVFSSSASSSAPSEKMLAEEEPEEGDKLPDTVLFKSPVIIVALTASSLQSDRHEALAAGCNDFLTKPVNFVWLERKVMEWGCMQALIDFDGWRKWKDFSSQQAAEKESADAKKKDAQSVVKAKKKNRNSMGSLGGLGGQGGSSSKLSLLGQGGGRVEGEAVVG
ncbi:hypothetical protein BELL_0947g00030 [Botrytis elliptica]|uniref:Response regulatory domain-containing protein n=1 Tax=Botrytis elliptica TaxID=278938 RepID=A0A4Z1J0C3_9HELO|nr:hypothetical protein EAE99_002570 [Botrytis elliptica]TGO66564.1 hypothetical protein BELL_0947g00030 [Botrytis elliptica]